MRVIKADLSLEPNAIQLLISSVSLSGFKILSCTSFGTSFRSALKS